MSAVAAHTRGGAGGSWAHSQRCGHVLFRLPSPRLGDSIPNLRAIPRPPAETGVGRAISGRLHPCNFAVTLPPRHLPAPWRGGTGKRRGRRLFPLVPLSAAGPAHLALGLGVLAGGLGVGGGGARRAGTQLEAPSRRRARRTAGQVFVGARSRRTSLRGDARRRRLWPRVSCEGIGSKRRVLPARVGRLPSGRARSSIGRARDS